MAAVKHSTTTVPDWDRLAALLFTAGVPTHIHSVDMPYRLTSTWHEYPCQLGLWEHEAALIAWALFMPAWWNVDYVLHPSRHGSQLEADIISWGMRQMQTFATAASKSFYGSVELFADSPNLTATQAHLDSLGFTKFDWSTRRFTLNLETNTFTQPLPPPLRVRPLKGIDEVDAYVELHRAAFGTDMMTTAWRKRTLAHPAYDPTIDLVLVNDKDEPIGFCICWQHGATAHIEPLGIHPDYQGQGVGQALEHAACRLLQARGVRTLQVDHTSFNEAAIALALRTGFQPSNDALRYYIEVTP